MRTAENLKVYLEGRAKYRAPIGIEIQGVEAWVIDIIRVVATLGRSLLSSPVCIYSLMPSLCPTDSILRQRFGSSSRSLEVVGLSAQTWSDRICCVYYGQDRSNAIACRDNRYAVGLWSGVIFLYLALTFQEDGRLDHGEPVELLGFAPANNFLVSGGRRKIVLWNIDSRTIIWQVQPLHEPLSLNFDGDDMVVMAATRGSYIGFWRTSDGMELKLCPWHDSTEQSGTNQTPIMTRCSTELKLLAAAYRGQPITLWDLEDDEFIGQLGLPHSVVGMTFSADPQMYLIVAAYRHGQLVLYDTEVLEEKATFESVAHILASSPVSRWSQEARLG